MMIVFKYMKNKCIYSLLIQEGELTEKYGLNPMHPIQQGQEVSLLHLAFR